jgi:hypothetical protein
LSATVFMGSRLRSCDAWSAGGCSRVLLKADLSLSGSRRRFCVVRLETACARRREEQARLLSSALSLSKTRRRGQLTDAPAHRGKPR